MISPITIDRINPGGSLRPWLEIYQGTLPTCSHTGDRHRTEITYPAKGMTATGSNGKTTTSWIGAVVVDKSGKAKIFYQYSDFVARTVHFGEKTGPCTQGLFISDDDEVLDFRSNEPRVGLGEMRLNGEVATLNCSSF